MGKSDAGVGAVAGLPNRRWASHRMLAIGLWLTVMMLAVKVWAGWATRSLSLLADALHTLVVTFSLLLSLIAVSRPIADLRGLGAQYRDLWGHTRLESGLTLLWAAGLGFAGCSLVGIAVWQGQQMLAEPPIALPVQITLPLIHVLGAIAAVSLGIGLLGRQQARSLDSSALGYSFGYSLRDTALMLTVLLELWGVSIGIDWLDPLLTGFLVLMAGMTSWHLLNHQLPSLLRQVAIAPEAVVKITRQVEGILHCYDVRSRGMVGRFVDLELRLILHPECLEIAPEIAGQVEKILRHRYGPARIIVHVDRGEE